MTNLILVGAGGCMKEFLWQLEEENKRDPQWNILGIVDKVSSNKEEHVMGYPILGDDDFLIGYKEPVAVGVCVGSSALRKKIVSNLKQNPNLSFPVLKGPNVRIAPSAILGQGVILSMDTIISVETKVGDFAFFNIGASISHEGVVGNYTSVSLGVKIAGNVNIGDDTELGMGVQVIQGKNIGSNVVIGAGSVVVSDIPDNTVAVGVPAKVIRGRENV